MSKETKSSSAGVGVFGLLGVVFITLKLLGITAVADWSWWWVTLPLWGTFALAASLMLAIVVGGLIIAAFKK